MHETYGAYKGLIRERVVVKAIVGGHYHFHIYLIGITFILMIGRSVTFILHIIHTLFFYVRRVVTSQTTYS